MPDVAAQPALRRQGLLLKLTAIAFLAVYFGSARWLRPEQWVGAAFILNGAFFVLLGTVGYRKQRQMIAFRCRRPDILQASRQIPLVRFQRTMMRRMFHSGCVRFAECAVGALGLALGLLILLFF